MNLLKLNMHFQKVKSKMDKRIKLSSKESLKLGVIAVVCLFAVFAVFNLSKESAKKSEANYLTSLLEKVVAKGSFDNDLLATKQSINNNIYYQACLKGKPTFQIIEVSTKDGYSGKIKLLVSIDNKANIYKIIPLFHRETPGLGDQIEISKSNWLQQFQLNTNNYKTVELKKDGGKIDSITGATITSRAVTKLISKEFFEDKQNQINNKFSCE